MDVNINNLSEEQISFFVDKYIEFFEKIQQNVETSYNKYKPYIENYRMVSNLRITPKGKLLFIAKKLVRNVFLSRFTGIEPIYLDSDTSPIINNEQKRWEFYQKCDLRLLINKVFESTMEALKRIISDLKDSEKKKEHIVLIRELNECYKECINFLNGYNPKEEYVFEILLATMFNKTGYTSRDQYLQSEALRRRGAGIEMTIQIPSEIKAIYDEYGEMNNSKMR